MQRYHFLRIVTTTPFRYVMKEKTKQFICALIKYEGKKQYENISKLNDLV